MICFIMHVKGSTQQCQLTVRISGLQTLNWIMMDGLELMSHTYTAAVGLLFDFAALTFCVSLFNLLSFF